MTSVCPGRTSVADGSFWIFLLDQHGPASDKDPKDPCFPCRTSVGQVSVYGAKWLKIVCISATRWHYHQDQRLSIWTSICPGSFGSFGLLWLSPNLIRTNVCPPGPTFVRDLLDLLACYGYHQTSSGKIFVQDLLDLLAYYGYHQTS